MRATLLMFAIAALVAAFPGGCVATPALPKPPTIYEQSVASLTTTPAHQSAEIEIVYATDRMRIKDDAEGFARYGQRRSPSLTAGRAIVRLGEELAWEDLLVQSLDPKGKRIKLHFVRAEETIRFPSSIAMPVRIDGVVQEDPAVLAALADARQALCAELTRRLELTDRKEVFIFVHGVGNEFEDPMYRMAALWHFMGRPGVPVVYTWPARKGGGPLRGYTYARESSEFTIYHMRQFLQAVAACGAVEKIHILAHSRGTDLTFSTLRDLRLLYYHDTPAAHRELKLGNVILAAADIDVEVAQQRFRSDRPYEILDRLTLYLTPDDDALGLAEMLFVSTRRVGSLRMGELLPEQQEALRDDRLGFDAIDVQVKRKGVNEHSYWIDSPAVLSDIILLLRDNRPPGRENGRPLLRAPTGVWELHDGYPNAGVHASDGQ